MAPESFVNLKCHCSFWLVFPTLPLTVCQGEQHPPTLGGARHRTCHTLAPHTAMSLAKALWDSSGLGLFAANMDWRARKMGWAPRVQHPQPWDFIEQPQIWGCYFKKCDGYAGNNFLQLFYGIAWFLPMKSLSHQNNFCDLKIGQWRNVAPF